MEMFAVQHACKCKTVLLHNGGSWNAHTKAEFDLAFHLFKTNGKTQYILIASSFFFCRRASMKPDHFMAFLIWQILIYDARISGSTSSTSSSVYYIFFIAEHDQTLLLKERLQIDNWEVTC
jgi:hypothetical protein